MYSLIQDVRYALRGFLKSPGFSTIALLTLALGIGANTAVFSVVNAVLLGLREIPEHDRIAFIFTQLPSDRSYNTPVSFPNFVDWREQSESFTDMGIYGYGNYNLSGGDRPERVRAVLASASLLPILGFDAKIGRIFGPEEERPEADRVAVVSHSLWQRRFGADPNVVGQTITLDDAPATVLGVLPPHVERAQGRFDLWVPLRPDPAEYPRGRFSFRALGRLKPGVDFAQAQTELQSIAARLAESYPDSNQDVSVNLRPLVAVSVDDNSRSALSALVVGAGLLLLIACVNVANLLLARGTTRQREYAVRTAVGAGRWRLARQMLVECGVLALAGGALGVVVACWGMDVMATTFLNALPRTSQITVDSRVLAFALLVSVVSAALFGIVPALKSPRVNLTEMLKEGVRSASCARGGGRGRELLVVAQLAMALALVTCAGLMIKSILTLRAIDPGLETRQLLTMRVTPGGKAYEEQGRRAAFFQAAAHGIRQIPGVVSAAAVSTVPLSGSGTGMSFTVEDERAVVTGRARLAGFMVVTPGYFQTMNIPLLAGRDFTEFDTSETEGVVIVSKGLAELLWPGENPLGRRLKHAPRDDPDPWLTVIGVVGDVRHYGLDQGFRRETYRPLAQQGSRAATFVARTIGDPLRAATAARRAVHEIDPDLAVYGVQSMEDIVVASVGEPGILAKVLAAFATIALVLAAVGLYGVVSYAVNQRTREIGIRIVLGARPQDALRLIISRSLLLTVLGIAVGVGLALALAQTLESLMYGVSPADPATLVGTAALLVAVALLASYIPARRATKVDPMVALRYE